MADRRILKDVQRAIEAELTALRQSQLRQPPQPTPWQPAPGGPPPSPTRSYLPPAEAPRFGGGTSAPPVAPPAAETARERAEEDAEAELDAITVTRRPPPKPAPQAAPPPPPTYEAAPPQAPSAAPASSSPYSTMVGGAYGAIAFNAQQLSARISRLEQMRQWLTEDESLANIIDGVIGQRVKASESRQFRVNLILSLVFLVIGWALSTFVTSNVLANLLHPAG